MARLLMGRLSRRSIVIVVAAGLLVILSSKLPVWGMLMDAPQYPEGLRVVVYPHGVQGDIEIINILNHYVGMKPIEPNDFAEFRYVPMLMMLLGLLVIGSALSRRRWSVVVVLCLTLLGGIAGLMDLQGWLYEYGHDLDPTAPLDFEPFTPPMVGSNVIWNFETVSYFLTGTYVLALAGLMMLYGLLRDGTRVRQTVDDATPTAVKTSRTRTSRELAPE